MARPRKEDTGVMANEEVGAKASTDTSNPEYVDIALKDYPELKKAYVSVKGHVFTEGSPEYLVRGMKLYTNKYFTQNNN